MRELTEKQKKVLEFIENYISEHGYPPSIRDIARRFRITPRGAQIHLKALEKKGYIIRTDGRARAMRLVRKVEGVSLPVVGVIAAGEAIEMFEVIEDYVEVPRSMVDPNYDHFILRVKGDSMIGDHIINGDLVVMRRQDLARNGDIVAVAVDNSFATLKRIYFANDHVVLRPSNPDLEDIVVKGDRIRIMGRLVGLLRMY